MCCETLRIGLIFPRQSIWGVTCLGLLEKGMFSHLSPWKPMNVLWNPQKWAPFSKTINLRGHMPRFTLKTSSGCSSMQGNYAQLTGVHLPSIYMHCTRSSSGCSGMQGLYAWLTGGSICLLYICIVLYLAVGVVVCKASMLNWLGGPSAFYIYALY